MKILVIGESCRDIFIYGTCVRLTPEAPVPVFNPISTIENGGMAKNVQKNVLGLSIDCNLLTNDNWQTISKARYIEQRSNHMFLRVDKNDKSYGRINLGKIDFPEYDAIIISDYNKGFISEEDIKFISQKHSNTFLDTKKVLGKWCREIGFIKINNFEYEKTKYNLDEVIKSKLIVTLGSGGALHRNIIYPVKKVEVKDVAGAGDTFIAALAIKFTEAQDISEAVDFANHCATEVVQKKGVSVCNTEEIK
jgi:D-glycero-beta-D-manno-heptose-7-phosphate kinase